ncbi:MAG: sulfatase-like hydrolase/transferase [Planctomycetota bacterium]
MTDLFAALLARPEKTPGADVFGPLVRRATAAAAVAVLLVCQGLPAVAGERTRQPNVVFILADDLGYGDVSCYGQENWKTPNIDRLAAEGMRFTQFYAGATVCSPSRSCLMTGLHTGNTQVRGNRRPEPGLPADAVTVAEVLSEAGYACGAFGKWGLGLNGSAGAPLEQGFDRYFGHTSQMLAHNYFPYTLWEDRTVFDVEANAGTARGGYSAELIYEQSLNFIRDNADRPFFCYIPTTIPHAEMAAPERLVAKFRGKFGPETPYEGARPGHPRFRIGGYEPCAEPKATYAAMIA